MITVLFIDGFGIAPAGVFNAVSRSNMSSFYSLMANYPSLSLAMPDFVGDIFSRANRYLLAGNLSDNLSIIDVIEKYSMRSVAVAGPEAFLFLKHFFYKKWPNDLSSIRLVDIRKSDENFSISSLIEPVVDVAKKYIIGGDHDMVICSLDCLMSLIHDIDMDVIINGLESVDKAIDILSKLVLSVGGTLFISSPYGCVESLGFGELPALYGSVTLNPVPLVMVDSRWEGRSLGNDIALGSDLMLLPKGGFLSDLPHMCLSILGLDDPHIKKRSILDWLL